MLKWPMQWISTTIKILPPVYFRKVSEIKNSKFTVITDFGYRFNLTQMNPINVYIGMLYLLFDYTVLLVNEHESYRSNSRQLRRSVSHFYVTYLALQIDHIHRLSMMRPLMVLHNILHFDDHFDDDWIYYEDVIFTTGTSNSRRYQ